MAGKMRSPNYPALSLAQVVDAAERLWTAEKRTAVSNDTAAAAFGFKALSGPARVTIGALRQYGFIEKAERGHIRLSDLAVTALHGEPTERAGALRRAALTPPLFRELSQTHSDGSETALRSHLLTKRDFAPDGARKAAIAFRDTMKFAFANDSAKGHNGDTGEKEPEDMPDNSTGQIPIDAKAQPKPGVAREVSTFDEGEAVLQWPATMSAASVQELEDWLTLVVKKLKRRYANAKA